MNYPEMIFFDQGHTLTHSPEKSRRNGFSALWEHVCANPHDRSFEDFTAAAQRIFDDVDRVTDSFDYDIPFTASLRLLTDSLGISLDIPTSEQEYAFLKAARPVVPMPGAAEMLEFLGSRGIRRAVVSNNRFSGEALLRQNRELFGESCVEFVISSADYMVRKPDKRLFLAALSRGGVSPENVWHCGDVANSDVMGARYSGIFPVLYEEMSVDDPFLRFNKSFTFDDGELLRIGSWNEFCRVIEELEMKDHK